MGTTSIPKSIYWAIVTLTTVGYGDISPQTDLGKFISSFIMVLGYSIIVVPTGFVTAAMTKRRYFICDNCQKYGDLSPKNSSNQSKKKNI